MPYATQILKGLIAVLLCAPLLSAQEKKQPKDDLKVSQAQVMIGDRAIDYEVTAGTMALKDDKGKHRADVFHIAYIRKVKFGTKSKPRPVTFVFNGGPGSSSVWLHLGVIGPKRVVMTDKGEALPPPGKFVDNEHTWLQQTDLVFIDPVGTGYSRPAPGVKGKEFYGVDEDISSVGDFIELWVTKNRRWNSPKFLAGESYGTTRAAGLSGYLQETCDMYLNGIALISPILQFQTARFDTGNDLPYPLFLPTYTATAWYHKCLGKDLQQDLATTLKESEAFALGEYWTALAKGDALSEKERNSVVGKLARYTGLSPEFIKASKLRVTISAFTKELRRDEGVTVGRLDSRFTGLDRTQTGTRPSYDPSLAAITGPYTAALNHYLRANLGYENDRRYRILGGLPWNYGNYKNRYLNVAETLRKAMTKNPHLKVWVCSGYYDLATPYFAMEYTVSHMMLDPKLRPNIHTTYYESGHMMYIHKPSLEKFNRDYKAFMLSIPSLN
ncbi:MAG: peptidase S10 [Planctomycetota bacterium]